MLGLPCRANGALNRPGSYSHIDLIRGWTCDGQHQSRGVTEVAVELDGPSPLRQLVIERVELQIDVGKLLLGVGDAVVELYVDKRQTGKADGADTEIGGQGRFD